MKRYRTASCHRLLIALLIAGMTAAVACHSNKPAVGAQSSQPATAVATVRTNTSPAATMQTSSSPAATPTPDQPTEAAEHFAKGKKLIEENCIDCGGTRAGVEEGMSELQKAIDLKYEPAKDAFRLLADAYADLTTFTKEKGEQDALWTKQNEIFGRLYELDPHDPQILQDYALRVAKTNEEKIRVLQEAVQIDPKRAPAQILLSLSLIEKKDFPHGISALQEAVKNESNGESLVNDVSSTLEALDKNGCSISGFDQEHWKEEANSASSRSTFREGDPKAIPEFKERFLKFTSDLICPNLTAAASH